MFDQIKEWWEGTSEREQQLTLVSGVVIFIAIVYFLIWQPLATNLEDNQQKLNKAEQTLQWVETSATKLVAAGVGGNQKTKRKQNLSQLINTTAKRNSISISRIQNQEEQVDVWINEIEFTQFLKWITTLQNDSNVHVISVDLSRTKIEGMVKVNRLSLSY
ncbi:type II secretion system protein M [Psychromonas sp.]|nr:type II secretion system protein M [Psychromonas sp.]